MGKLFGTDGIRGIAFEFLDHDFAKKVGRALGCVLSENKNASKKVLIGADTRISGKMLTDALSEGLSELGFDTYILGVIPTPAVAYLTKTYGFDAGVMVSASHNPYEYNGIKIFGSAGFKLKDEEEDRIEALINSGVEAAPDTVPGKTFDADDFKKKYAEYLKKCTKHDFSGIRIAMDCANGSASATAKEIFGDTGAEIEFFACEPNGENINSNCGSTHLEPLQKTVKEGNFDIGIAFDGDADRCLFVDSSGREIDGDFTLAILSLSMRKDGKLASDMVVGTVMANCGFVKFCNENNINFIATKVGDRYVLEEMEKRGYSLGGEQSGHIIIRECATTGDGQLTALFMLAALAESKKTLIELSAIMKKYPQHMINIKTTPAAKDALKTDEDVKKIISDAEAALNGDGRLLIRPSGTEPLIRVMIECSDEEKTVSLCKKVADDIENALKKY